VYFCSVDDTSISTVHASNESKKRCAERDDDVEEPGPSKRHKTDLRLMKGEQKCTYCKHHLCKELFVLDDMECDACVRKQITKRMFFPRTKTSINNTFITHRIPAGDDAIDSIPYFRSVTEEIVTTLIHALHLHTSIHWLLGVITIFEREIDGVLQETRFEFNSNQQVLLRQDQIDDQVESTIARLIAAIIEIKERESGFVFKRVFQTTVRLGRFNPLGGHLLSSSVHVQRCTVYSCQTVKKKSTAKGIKTSYVKNT